MNFTNPDGEKVDSWFSIRTVGIVCTIYCNVCCGKVEVSPMGLEAYERGMRRFQSMHKACAPPRAKKRKP